MNCKKAVLLSVFLCIVFNMTAQSRSVIGIFPFESYEISDNDTTRIYDIFYDEMVNSGRFDVYSKKALFTWYQENSNGSPMSTGMAVEAGLDLNLDFSLYGSVSQLGKRFTIIVTQVDPETGLIEYVAREMVDSEKEITAAVIKVAQKFIERTSPDQQKDLFVEEVPQKNVVPEETKIEEVEEIQPEPEEKVEANTDWDVEWDDDDSDFEDWDEEEWEDNEPMAQENYFEFSIGSRWEYKFNPFTRALFTVGTKTRYDKTAFGGWVGISREEDWYFLGALQLCLYESEDTQKNATAISVIGRWEPNMTWRQIRYGVGIDWYISDNFFIRGTTMINDWLDISASVGWSF